MKLVCIFKITIIILIAIVSMPFNQQANANQSIKNMIEGKAYIQENGLKSGVISLPSGLQYKVLKQGSGRSPKINDSVAVHYTGTLINGTIFDTSRKPESSPAKFEVNRVIQGWTEALLLMKEGDRWQLTIPADIAYGDSEKPNIPAHSVLIFDVELVKVINIF
jgi:FKBP-type peptidyl-prolyl cis-trans isomerase FklB